LVPESCKRRALPIESFHGAGVASQKLALLLMDVIGVIFATNGRVAARVIRVPPGMTAHYEREHVDCVPV